MDTTTLAWRVVKTSVAIVLLGSGWLFAESLPARVFERAAAAASTALDEPQTFRDGYLEAMATARLQVPYDVPDWLLESIDSGPPMFRRLTPEQLLPVGDLGTARGHRPSGPMLRGFRWCLRSRVTESTARRVREALEAIRPSLQELEALTSPDASPGGPWTRVEFPTAGPSTNRIVLDANVSLFKLETEYVAVFISGPATIAKSQGLLSGDLVPPVHVWIDHEHRRVALHAAEFGRWLVLHIPSLTILYESED